MNHIENRYLSASVHWVNDDSRTSAGRYKRTAETQRILSSLSRRRDVKLWLARTVNPWLFAVTSAPTISILSGAMRPGAEITLPHTDADKGFLIRPHRQTNCPSILPFFLPLTRGQKHNPFNCIRTEPRSAAWQTGLYWDPLHLNFQQFLYSGWRFGGFVQTGSCRMSDGGERETDRLSVETGSYQNNEKITGPFPQLGPPERERERVWHATSADSSVKLLMHF